MTEIKIATNLNDHIFEENKLRTAMITWVRYVTIQSGLRSLGSATIEINNIKGKSNGNDISRSNDNDISRESAGIHEEDQSYAMNGNAIDRNVNIFFLKV